MGDAVKMRKEGEEKAEQHVNTTEIEAKKKETAAHDAVLAMLAKEKKVKEEAMKMRKEAEEEAVKMKREGEEDAEQHINTTDSVAKRKQAAAHDAVLAELAKEKQAIKEAEETANQTMSWSLNTL